MTPEKDSITMTWEDGHGNQVSREVNQVIDARKFFGTPGYSSLIVAANTHLSVADIERFLDIQSIENPYVYRPRSWIQRRRWLFQQPDAVNPIGRANRDGKDAAASLIMSGNLGVSLRTLSKLLKDRGITRSREWIRKHRGV